MRISRTVASVLFATAAAAFTGPVFAEPASRDSKSAAIDEIIKRQPQIHGIIKPDAKPPKEPFNWVSPVGITAIGVLIGAVGTLIHAIRRRG